MIRLSIYSTTGTTHPHAKDQRGPMFNEKTQRENLRSEGTSAGFHQYRTRCEVRGVADSHTGEYELPSSLGGFHSCWLRISVISSSTCELFVWPDCVRLSESRYSKICATSDLQEKIVVGGFTRTQGSWLLYWEPRINLTHLGAF